MVKILKRHYDVSVVSQKGSHIKVKKGNRKSIVPDHKQIVYGTFSAILEQLHIDEEDFLDNI